MRSRVVGVTVTALALASSSIIAPSAQASGVTWCWSMQSDTLRGTFTTDGTAPGDGSAPAGSYNLTGFAVYESAFTEIEVGSIARTTYEFGT